MISQRVLRTLLFSLAILLALFVVAAGSKTLFASGGDAPAATALHWVSLSMLLALVANVLLLVIALAIHATESPSKVVAKESSEAE